MKSRSGTLGQLRGILYPPQLTRLWLVLPEATLLSGGEGEPGAGRVGTHIAVPLNGGTDLLRAWCDGELGLALKSMGQRLLGHGCRAPHVLIAGVGAAADQTWCIVGGGARGQDQRSPPDLNYPDLVKSLSAVLGLGLFLTDTSWKQSNFLTTQDALLHGPAVQGKTMWPVE